MEFHEQMNSKTDCNRIEKLFFESMEKLYVRYINEELAALEINIASRLRKSIEDCFAQQEDEVDMRELLLLFDAAAVDILRLMTESAIRYSVQKTERNLISIMSDLESPENLLHVHSTSIEMESPSASPIVMLNDQDESL